MIELSRRDVLMMGAIAVLAGPLRTWGQAVGEAATRVGTRKRVLFLTKSQTFPHSVVTRKAGADGKPSGELALAERLLKEWGEAAGLEVVVTKEGSDVTPESVKGFDAFVFYTTGDLTKAPADKKADQTSAMSAEGKAALIEAVKGGKGFVGIHSATDTFHSVANRNGPVRFVKEGGKVDPYIEMIGAEFTSHGSQQKAKLSAAAGRKGFAGLDEVKDVEIQEEWYSYTNLQRDLMVLQVLETSTMKTNAQGERERQYRGPAYPLTWVRMHGKGRVFSTGLGHREDVWGSQMFRDVVMAGVLWAAGVRGGEVKADVEKVCPLPVE